MAENKPYMLRAGYYHNYTGICKDKEENFTTNEVVDKLNEQDGRIKKLEKENERLQNCIHRKRLAVKWVKRDYDKLYQLCLDKGCTEDEIIKEMER